MKHIKKLLAAVTASALLLSGCGSAVINSDSDEIRNSNWLYDGKYTDASLRFDGDNCKMTVENAEISDSIEGLCVIDDERIVILDKNNSYSFAYTLNGGTLILCYGGGEISFERQKKPTAASARSIGGVH